MANKINKKKRISARTRKKIGKENQLRKATNGDSAPGPSTDSAASANIPGPSTDNTDLSEDPAIDAPTADDLTTGAPTADYLTTDAPTADDFPSDCAVRGCNSSLQRKPQMVFFPFPNNERRCAHWIRVIGRPELALRDVTELHTEYQVCIRHFRRDQIRNGSLAAHAVPMYFLPKTGRSVAAPPDPAKAKTLRSTKKKTSITSKPIQKKIKTKVVATQTEAALEGVTCVSCQRLLFGRTLRAGPPAFNPSGRPLTPTKFRVPGSYRRLSEEPHSEDPQADDEDYEPPEEEPMIDAPSQGHQAPQTSVFVFEYHPNPADTPPVQTIAFTTPDVMPVQPQLEIEPDTVVVKMEAEDDDPEMIC